MTEYSTSEEALRHAEAKDCMLNASLEVFGNRLRRGVCLTCDGPVTGRSYQGRFCWECKPCGKIWADPIESFEDQYHRLWKQWRALPVSEYPEQLPCINIHDMARVPPIPRHLFNDYVKQMTEETDLTDWLKSLFSKVSVANSDRSVEFPSMGALAHEEMSKQPRLIFDSEIRSVTLTSSPYRARELAENDLIRRILEYVESKNAFGGLLLLRQPPKFWESPFPPLDNLLWQGGIRLAVSPVYTEHADT